MAALHWPHWCECVCLVVSHDMARLPWFYGTGCNQLNWAGTTTLLLAIVLLFLLYCFFVVLLFCCIAFCCTALFIYCSVLYCIVCTACRCRRAAGLPLWLSQSAKELSPWCRAPPREQQQQLGQPKAPPGLAWHLECLSVTAGGHPALLVLSMKPMNPATVSNWACFLFEAHCDEWLIKH